MFKKRSNSFSKPRKFPRYDVLRLVKYVNNKSHEYHVKLKNLSRSGLLISAEASLDYSEKFRIKIFNSKGYYKIFNCIVIRKQYFTEADGKDYIYIGAKFIFNSDVEYIALKNIIKNDKTKKKQICY